MFIVVPPKDSFAFNNTISVASYSKIDADCKLLLRESCIRILNDIIQLVEPTQSFKFHFGYDLDHKFIGCNEL